MKVLTVLSLLFIGSTAVAFQKLGSATGVVVDSQGNPLPGVELHFTSPVDERVDKSVTTDSKGQFKVSGIKLVFIEVAVNLEGHQPKILQYEQKSGTQEIEVIMLTVDEALQAALESGALDDDPKLRAADMYQSAVPLFQEKKYAEALLAALGAIDLDPDLAAAMKMAAMCSYNTQNWEEAKEFAQLYLDLKPDDADMVQLMSQADAEQQGNSPSALYNKAIEAINLDDDETAEKALLDAIAMDASFSMAYYDLGQIYVRAFEFEKAIENFKKFLELAPDHKYAAEVKDLIATLSE